MKTIKTVIIFLIFLISLVAIADDVQTEISPTEAIVNESFFVTFRVKVTGDSEPYISFTPSGAQVLGKKEQGISIQTFVINGKFTSTKEQSIVYELISERSGLVTLRNIKVDINGKIQTVKDIHVNVLATPRRIADAFMEAQVSKTKVYVGEGIDVNYYLYFKSSISANDVKDFPKLNKFIKRFHHINSPVETVQYKNEVLKRILAYSARIYPEKVGMAVIDPMKISVQIIENDHNGFGFGTQRFKNKDLASNRVEIDVMPLPTENIPAGFTGLVGEHEFVLTPAKDKYLVNEPIEFKLEVKGKGALEKMEAPGIYTDPNLETFDTKAEVTELGNNNVKKVFEYTYLARNALSIKARELSLAYFDPSSGKYVEKKISIPGIDVSGVAAPINSNNQTQKDAQQNEMSKSSDTDSDFLSRFFSPKTNKDPAKKINLQPLSLVGPFFIENSSFKTGNYLIFINVFLMIILIIFVFTWYKSNENSEVLIATNNQEAKVLIKKLKKNGMEHSSLYKLLTLIDKKNKMSQGGVSIFVLIDESPISNGAKVYFKNSLEICEQQLYGESKTLKKLEFNNSYFNEVLKIV